MRLFDKLTGGGVDWQIELASTAGAFKPGDEVSGVVRYMPKGNMQPRSIRVALVCSEHYVYLVRDRSSGGSRNSDGWERQWYSDDLLRQEVEISGPTSLAAQTPGEFPFKFQIPPEATASFDSSVLRLRWQIRAWMDVGGKDPSSERDIYVVVGSETLSAQEVALAPSVADPQGQASIYLEPAPLIVGQPFRGYVETTEQLDLRSVRVELKQNVATSGGSGGGASLSLNTATLSLGGKRNVAEDRVLWTGQLSPMEGGTTGQRYQFAGQLALAPVGTVNLPHGASSATIDVVISRRLVPDRHIARPVAIVTG